MIENRALALSYIDEDEGPELNISAGEPGGSSCHGVTMELLRIYAKAHGLPEPTLDDMRAMTSDVAGKIYSWRFLDPLRFDELPPGVDYRVADAAISLGGTGACLILQMALATYPFTGVMDDRTLAAARAADPLMLVTALDAAWLAWKHGLSADGWVKYNHGWLNRIIKVRDRVSPMIGRTK